MARLKEAFGWEMVMDCDVGGTGEAGIAISVQTNQHHHAISDGMTKPFIYFNSGSLRPS